jgi:hypothetical protein
MREYTHLGCHAQERARFEAAALEEEAKHAPEHVPELYLYDESMAIIVMQYLAPPHVILRVALTQGRTFPNLARHVGSFLARTLFKTSLFALDSTTWRCGNVCGKTQNTVFTDTRTVDIRNCPRTGIIRRFKCLLLVVLVCYLAFLLSRFKCTLFPPPMLLPVVDDPCY